MIDRDRIAAAARRIAEHVRHTPVLGLETTDLGLQNDVTLKLELLQHTGSFKPRGAFNRILSHQAPTAGVIAASGGNHGQAVAYAAMKLGHRAEIFLPKNTPTIKVSRLREYGAEVILFGSEYDEARAASEARAAETKGLLVHAYDQADVVAGQGTIGAELEGQVPGLDTLLVAVGGGGLIGGIAAWFEGRTKVVGVESEGCPTLCAALAAGQPVDVRVGGLAADSLGARKLGRLAFEIARRHVAEALLVPDAAIRKAQLYLWKEVRLVSEPGGVTALAALLHGCYRPQPGEEVGVLVCGGNTDPRSLEG